MKAQKSRKAFGAKLAKIRTEHNMTKKFVAESIGVSLGDITKWEDGVAMIDADSLLKITILYDLPHVGLLEKLERDEHLM
ncbi:MAG: helix-turn-helix transcriptional regulator [Clostridiaceae bacterium]|nr:helix-turn-helix transcriptional regulator [Clostridiaceae bacterium]